MFYNILRLLFLTFVLNGCYISKLAWKQNALINSRQPIDEVIAEGNKDPKTLQRLKFIREVLDFAKANGLKTGGAYQHYVEIDQKAISYIVLAAKPQKFEMMQWWFPIVGSVPYLGYFEEIERDQKAMDLETMGYDVHASNVTAFSSLGWFQDPIYSTMLKRDAYRIAHLIFHELTHRTIWIGSEVKFNENLAEFVAEVLTEEFFKSRTEWQQVKKKVDARRKDRKLFRQWLAKLKKTLELLYKCPKQKNVLAEKEIIIKDFVYGSNRPKFERYDFVGTKPWNNARIMANNLYQPDLAAFLRVYRCAGRPQMGTFLARLESQAETLEELSTTSIATLCSRYLSPIAH